MKTARPSRLSIAVLLWCLAAATLHARPQNDPCPANPPFQPTRDLDLGKAPSSKTTQLVLTAAAGQRCRGTIRVRGTANATDPFRVSAIEPRVAFTFDGAPPAPVAPVSTNSVPALPATSVAYCVSFPIDLPTPAGARSRQDVRVRITFKKAERGVGRDSLLAKASADIALICFRTPAGRPGVSPDLLVETVGRNPQATNVTVRFTVVNLDTAQRNVTLNLQATRSWRIITAPPANVALAPGALRHVDVTVEVPGGLAGGTTNDLTLNASFAGVPNSSASGTWRIEIAPDPPPAELFDGDGVENQLRINGHDPSDFPGHLIPALAPYNIVVDVANGFGDVVPFVLITGSGLAPSSPPSAFPFLQVDCVAPAFLLFASTPFTISATFPASMAGMTGPPIQAVFFDRQIGGYAATDGGAIEFR